MSESKSCVVVTTFAEGQPGFLDFSYRIKTLSVHYRLTVVSTFPLTQPELQLPNVDYVVIKTSSSRMGWLNYLLCCAKLIRKHQPSVAVLLHSMAAPVAMLAGRVPTVTYWNEHPTHVAPQPETFAPVTAIVRSLARWIMFNGARKSSLVLPIGEAHRDDLIAHGCLQERTRMMYMGVVQSFYGVALRHQAKEEDAPVRLVYVGSVHQDRGRDVMLQAIAISNAYKKIAHLTIVGASDEQANDCHKIIQHLGIVNSVSIHGRVPGQMIPDFMRDADAGLCLWEDLPWYRYNPPTKLFEYLVAGLPVLASNIRTHTQYVQNGINGFVFEYDSLSLAQMIQHFWSCRSEIAAMKLRSINSSESYLWNNIEPQFLQAIKGVAS
jgi:glycosyltransferase involved in cell wall biosynthesis